MKKYKTMDEMPLNVQLSRYEIPGTLVWKGMYEYNIKVLYGDPYFLIYKGQEFAKDGHDYLFRLDTDTQKYELIEVGPSLTGKGLDLDRALGKILFPPHEGL